MGSAAAAADRLRATVSTDRAVRAAMAAMPAPAASAGASASLQETRWRGASRMLRSLQAWRTQVGSGTSDLPRHELVTLRSRSRDASRNTPLARGALVRSRTSVVGTGLVCRPAIDHNTLGITSKQAEAIGLQIVAAWERWAETPLECDWEGAFDFYGLQGLTLFSAMASGDVFALTPQQQRAGGSNRIKVQLVEADRVCNPSDAIDTPQCIDGITLADGMPTGCWVRNTHPGDTADMRMPAWQWYPFVDAATGQRRVLQVWNDKDRPGQVRGAPYLAPVLEPLKQLDRYGDAELMSAVISAMFTVFITRDKDLIGENGEDIAPIGEADAMGNVALGNAAVVDLAPGEDVHDSNPARPNPNFDPFFTAVVKQIGATLEIPLDVLLLQFNSSYSAARAAMLEAWRFFSLRRWWLVQQFCQPVYNLFLDEEVASGRLRLPGYADPIRRHAWRRALWIGPARGSMDEGKEANAAKTRIEIGVSNAAMETAAMNGEDWSTVNAGRAREIAQMKANGTWVEPAKTPAAAATPAVERPASEGAGDGTDQADDGAETEEEGAAA